MCIELVINVLILIIMSKFFLRTSKIKGEATLYVQVMRRNPKIKFIFSTQISVDIDTWCNANKDINTWNRFHNGKGKELCDKLDKINETIDGLIESGVIERDIIIDAVMGIVYKEQREELKLKEEEEAQKRAIEEQKQRDNVVVFYEYFMQGIKEGTIQHKGKRYSKGSLLSWGTFGNVLRSYYKEHPFTFDSIDKRTADSFTLYMSKDLGMMPKTCNKYIICIRRLCRYAAEIGLNKNATSLTVWAERTVKEQDKQKEIYLTDAEIDALYNMDLKGIKSQIRDIFVIGALTAQRFSDYSRLSMDNVITTDRSNKVIVLIQQKTQNKVIVPIIDDRVISILSKYNAPLYEIKDKESTKCWSITEQVFNRTIKEICKDLAESVVYNNLKVYHPNN